MKWRFSTDQEVPEDGVYYVYHEAHRLIRTVRLHQGQRFPRCSQCRDQVIFELMFPVDSVPAYEPIHLFELPLAEDGEQEGGAADR